MKTIYLLLTLLVISITTKAQGKLILIPQAEFTQLNNTKATALGLSIGVSGLNESTISVGIFQRKYLTDINGINNFTSGQLTTSIYLLGNLGINGNANISYGSYLDKEATKGDEIHCPCTGKIIGYKPDTRDISETTRITGSLGLIYKIGNTRIYANTVFNDYNPNAWYLYKRNPYKIDSYKVGLAYVFKLKQYYE